MNDGPARRHASVAVAAARLSTWVTKRRTQAFADTRQPTVEHWRSVVVFGRNVASYKFALAKSLLDLGHEDREFVTIEELAVPFSSHVCEHIANVDRRGTFTWSRFLDACRYYNSGRINRDELETATVTLGFNNVIDAPHRRSG